MNKVKTFVKALALLALLAGACDDDDNRPEFVQGTYTGHFQRSTPTGDWMVANVTLELGDHSFSGESDHARYPAICNGTYTTEGNNITFVNKCVWTADFDWTLILDGTFEIRTGGGQVILIKKYNEHEFDQYTLTKQ